MKLFPYIFIRIALSLIVILSAWAYLFYRIIVTEFTDETDETLSEFSEQLISRSLANEVLPQNYKGTNNEFFFRSVSKAYADTKPHISFEDKDVYIHSSKEKEPARIMRTIYYVGQGKYKELTVYTPTIEKLDLRRSILFGMIILFTSLTCILLLVITISLKRSIRPLHKLLDKIKEYRLGNSTPITRSESSVQEFDTIYDDIMMFIRRNEEVYEQQKLFIGNASHEIQTPLAIAMNRIEQLMNQDLKEEHLVELDKIYSTLHRLDRLNKELLLLCRVENRQFTDIANICFNDIFHQLSVDYEEVFASRRINLEVEVNQTFCASFSTVLASTLMAIMLKNAYTHTTIGGTIIIRFYTDGIQFLNSGESPLPSDRIFEYFYHDKNSESSVGIGLPLAQSICKYSGYTLKYSFAEKMHIFSVTR